MNDEAKALLLRFREDFAFYAPRALRIRALESGPGAAGSPWFTCARWTPA